VRSLRAGRFPAATLVVNSLVVLTGGSGNGTLNDTWW